MTHRLTAIAALSLCLLVVFPLAAAKHDTWVEVRSPNFIVVSNAGEKQARKTAVQFEQIRDVFRRSLAVAGAHPSPLITILAVKDEDSMHALLPDYWSKGHVHPSGIFFSWMSQFYGAVRLDSQQQNPYETIYHEYYHSLTLPYFPNLPLWVSEGLADFFGNTEISSDHARMGLPDEALVYELHHGFMPLDALFKVDHNSPFYNETNKTGIFYAESWALIHYLMVADHESHKQTLMNYLDALNSGASQDDAATKAFGNLKQLETNLKHYTDGSTFTYLKGPPPAAIPDSDLHARELSDAEVDAVKGGFFATRSRTQEARPLLEEALRLDPKLAAAYQNLALVELLDGNRKEALESASRAIELDPKNSLTRYLRGYLAFNQAPNVRDPQIEADLRQAIAANSDFLPPYALLAVYLAGENENLPEALTFAQKTVSAEPGNSSYVLSLAQVLAPMRRYDEAQKAGMHARALATDAEGRALADQFLSYLAQVRDYESRRQQPSAEINPRGTRPSEPATARNNFSTSDDGDTSNDKNAEGSVTKVTCNGSEMIVRITTRDDRELTLHARDYRRVNYDQDVAFATRDFEACTQLEGHTASIGYRVTRGKGYDGEIENVEVEQ
jgi:tetratricopeptide (TPR) repeat protein